MNLSDKTGLILRQKISMIRKNIVAVTSSYTRYPGDATAPFVKSICDQLAEYGHKIEVIAPYDPDIKPMDYGIVHVNRYKYIWPDRLHRMGHSRSMDSDSRIRLLSYFLLPFFLLSGILTLWRITSRHKAEVIYAHWVVPNGLIAAVVSRITGIPYIISLHGSDIFVAKKNRLIAKCARWIFSGSSAVTACSRDLRDAAVELGAPENTQLVAWGADPARFSPNLRARAPIEKNITDQPLRITSLGRLVEKKGFTFLISALPSVIKEFPNVQLVIGGNGPLLNRLKHQADEMKVTNYIQFPGEINWEKVPEFLANSDIFVLPSIPDRHGNVDGLPTVLLEAMGSAVPVIASDIGGVNLVLNNGINGMIIPPGDSGAIENSIIRLIRDKEMRRNLGKAARDSVLNEYNWRSVCQQISKLLNEAALAN